MNATPAFPASDTWLPHRVSYGEVDQMGFLYYGHYLHLFERSRGQFIRERGMSYAEVERRGLLLPVREAQVRYRAPSHYDELIFIRAGIQEWSRATVTFVYELRDASRERLLATGMTQHACVDAAFRPVRAPQWLKDMLDHPPPLAAPSPSR